MDWCPQAPSHYLNQYWLLSMATYHNELMKNLDIFFIYIRCCCMKWPVDTVYCKQKPVLCVQVYVGASQTCGLTSWLKQQCWHSGFSVREISIYVLLNTSQVSLVGVDKAGVYMHIFMRSAEVTGHWFDVLSERNVWMKLVSTVIYCFQGYIQGSMNDHWLLNGTH